MVWFGHQSCTIKSQRLNNKLTSGTLANAEATVVGLSKFANSMLTQAERKVISQSAKHLLHKKYNAKLLDLKQLNKKGKQLLRS